MGGGRVIIIAGLVLVAVINVEVGVGVVVRHVSLPSTTLRVRVLVVSAKLGGCSPVMAVVVVVVDAGRLCSIAGTYVHKKNSKCCDYKSQHPSFSQDSATTKQRYEFVH